mmetsp:Transcript_17545/g.43316  ORF Transcript_17545/g.43316 Transcript_17545/m.43316 type:complete len:80 (+) Transcript_17545:1631-1870(+)
MQGGLIVEAAHVDFTRAWTSQIFIILFSKPAFGGRRDNKRPNGGVVYFIHGTFSNTPGCTSGYSSPLHPNATTRTNFCN